MDNLVAVIEKRYMDYMEEVKKWDEDILTGKVGQCDLCPKKENLTEHHLIPKRLIRGANPQLAAFLIKLTINICTECHNKLHPENIWKKDLIELEKTFNMEAKRIDHETRQKLEAATTRVSLAQQELNNVNIKYNQQVTLVKGKEDQKQNLKKEILDLKQKIREKEQLLIDKEKLVSESHKERALMVEMAVVFYNLMELKKDQEVYKKRMKESIIEIVKRKKEEIYQRKGVPSYREFDSIFKRMTMAPMKLYTGEQTEAYNTGLDELQDLWDALMKEGIMEVFDVSEKEVKDIN